MNITGAQRCMTGTSTSAWSVAKNTKETNIAKASIMEITGKIIYVGQERGGVSARSGKSWKSQEFVIETQEQYPRKCVFSVFGEEKLQQMNIKAGEVLTVSFDIDAREYNGRWYNEVQAWAVKR